jgi:hypothetical protein
VEDKNKALITTSTQKEIKNFKEPYLF